jgi:hypothetical protein
MVLDLLISLPILIATTEGVRQQSQQDCDEEQHYRMKDFHIDVFCNARSRKRDQVNRSMVVLRDGKVASSHSAITTSPAATLLS